MKKQIIIMALGVVCGFLLGAEMLMLSFRADAQRKQIKACEISITELSDDVEELKRIQENLNNDIKDRDDKINDLTKALDKATEEKTTEITTEEDTEEEETTEEKTTEKKTEATTEKVTEVSKTTEQPKTEAATETPTEAPTEAVSSGNVWGITVTETDITYLQRMAETETCGADMISKTHVISVAMNRAKTYGMSPYAVITSPNQFAYCNTGISQSTIDAVNYVLQNGDTAQGALFFHSGGYSATFCGRPCIFGDSVGHYFY